MLYQLNWKILPGLRGLSCSDFRATPTAAPNAEQGVAIDCASERDCHALLQELESHHTRFLGALCCVDFGGCNECVEILRLHLSMNDQNVHGFRLSG